MTPSGSHLHQVRFQMSRVALVQTQVLMETPVPNMAKRLIFSTRRLGRFLISQSGMGLLVCVAMVTLASHLRGGHAGDSGCRDRAPTALRGGDAVAPPVEDTGPSPLPCGVPGATGVPATPRPRPTHRTYSRKLRSHSAWLKKS